MILYQFKQKLPSVTKKTNKKQTSLKQITTTTENV